MKKILLFLFALLLSLPAYSYYVTLSQNSITCEDGVGNTYQLKAYLHNGSDVTDVTESDDMQWSSSDPSVATIDRKGLVTIHADGEAIIQMTTDKYTLEFTDLYHNMCRVTSLPVGGTALPMLREDLVWVSGADRMHYCITVEGDSVVNGFTYKKVFRRTPKGVSYHYLLPEGCYLTGYYIDSVRPAALMREANGRVYRLRGEGGADLYDLVVENLKYRLTRMEDMVEYVQYDFNNPDVYSSFGYRCIDSSYRMDDVVIEGTSRKVYGETNLLDNENSFWHKNLLMIEGLGMLNGASHGLDMLSPCRQKLAGHQPLLSTYYVRNNKGVVLLYYDNFYTYDSRHGLEIIENGGDPYDFDRDGSFDIADVNRVINIMTDLQEDDWDKTADLTFDGAVDIEDLNLMINRLVSGVKPIKYSDIVPNAIP